MSYDLQDYAQCKSAKVFIHMSKYEKPDWAIQQLQRSSGLIEDVCKHGIGHPNKQSVKEMGDAWALHGCDRCCIKK